jgi:hypothetical protein
VPERVREPARIEPRTPRASGLTHTHPYPATGPTLFVTRQPG